MRLNFITNKYLLMWYLLCRENNISKLDNFKTNFLSHYRKDYFLLIKEKDNIISLLKDYIPDDDFIFNSFYNTEEYKKLEKETNKYRITMLEYYDNYQKSLKKELTKLLKYDLNINYSFCFVHEDINIIEFYLKNKLIILGKKLKENEVLGFYIFTIYKILANEYKDYKPNEKDIVDAILELVIYNELYTRISGKNRYNTGKENIKTIKDKIYPYFLMYMGVNALEFDSRMSNDGIYFDDIKYDNNLKLMDLYSFISFIIKNKHKVLETNNTFKKEEIL
ncbi:MAG: hypothetical protein PUC23_02400 [bacterium]|nr:hypothetical protein [bacterium]